MRPRVFPAEDAGEGVNTQLVIEGFNEAAGIPRGRRHVVALVNAAMSTLQ